MPSTKIIIVHHFPGSLTACLEAVRAFTNRAIPVAVLDLAKCSLEYVNAGHLAPLHGADGQPFRYLPQPPGILVGINPQAEYPSATVSLSPGDQVVLYSDGVTEAVDRDDGMFGDGRLQELLTRQRPGSAAATVRQARDAVQDFAAGCPQSDDLTLLVLRLEAAP